MDRERFEKQLNFILEIDKEKQILRQTHIRGYSRQEDDAEHAAGGSGKNADGSLA